MPRVSLLGLRLWSATAPSPYAAAIGWDGGARYSSLTVMWGDESMRRLMKSLSEPRMSELTAMKKATPSVMPRSDITV
jgi:hypothetical protein